jgi:hypothetical protein
MSIIHFGCGSDFLTLRIHGRTKPDAQNYWDANWLHCTADASAGAFCGTLEWQLRNEDLARFMHALEGLDRQAGEALLETIDGWLAIQVIRDDQGHIEARCQLVDNSIGGSTLEFRLLLDQTVLPVLMDQLRGVLEQFPVLGRERA